MMCCKCPLLNVIKERRRKKEEERYLIKWHLFHSSIGIKDPIVVLSSNANPGFSTANLK